MIRGLRNKFIIISSGAVLLILSIVLSVSNSISYFSNYSDIMSILEFIVDNNGWMPLESPPKKDVDFHVTREIAYETRYFHMILDPEDNIAGANYDHIAAVTDSEASEFRDEVVSRSQGRGEFVVQEGIYFYLSEERSGKELKRAYAQKDHSGSYDWLDDDTVYRLVVFMDCTNRIYRMNTMKNFSMLAALICFCIFVIMISALSKHAIKPVIANYEKQKQFITNAGHELKTPLAIISANTEVIEAMDGKSEWTESIMNQVKRLTGLVNELIVLARLEEHSESNTMALESIDFSAKTKELADSFLPVAERGGKHLETDIEENIKIKCNEKSIHELLSILLDNAVKYCDDGGTIKAGLSRRKRQAYLEISNSYRDGENTNYSRFFERFYRGDTSHNNEKASGYGIGLSMAERVVKLHKGKISVRYSDGIIYFCVTLASE